MGFYYPDIFINQKKVEAMFKRNTREMEKCVKCIYKTVCFGGCVISALENGLGIDEPYCGVFSEKSILNQFGKLLF